jgi:hypothetical protein
VALAVLALPGLVCASCLNPQDDYNDYVNRAADAQVPPSAISTGEASTIDVASLRAPDGGFSGDYVMICVMFQLGADISKALLWKTQLVYSGGSNGGMLTFSADPLAAGSTSVDNPLMGPEDITNWQATVSEHGYATIGTLPTLNFPASFNGITGEPVQLEKAQILIQMESSTQICANIGGFIPEPAPVTLDPAQNACIYLPTNGSGQWASVQTSDVHCP